MIIYTCNDNAIFITDNVIQLYPRVTLSASYFTIWNLNLFIGISLTFRKWLKLITATDKNVSYTDDKINFYFNEPLRVYLENFLAQILHDFFDLTDWVLATILKCLNCSRKKNYEIKIFPSRRNSIGITIFRQFTFQPAHYSNKLCTLDDDDCMQIRPCQGHNNNIINNIFATFILPPGDCNRIMVSEIRNAKIM